MERVMWTPYKPMPVLKATRRDVSTGNQPLDTTSDEPRFSGGFPRSVGSSLRWLLLAGLIALPVSCHGTSGPSRPSPFSTAHPEHLHGAPGHSHSNSHAKGATADTWEGYMALSDQLHHAVEDKHDVLKTEAALNQALHKRLFPEMKSLFLRSYARSTPGQKREVVLGEFTHPDWENGGMDGGRGLRIAFRQTNNDDKRRTSVILFLDYNPTTQQFEWVNQKAGSKSPDIIRFLHETEPMGQDEQRGFMGVSYTGQFSSHNKLTGLSPTPYYTAQAEPRVAAPVSARILPDELQPAHCIMCHGRKERQQFFRIDFEKARVAPGVAHQKSVDEFDAYLQGRNVPIEQRQQIRHWLANPTQHWQRLLPKDFLSELSRLD